MTENPEKYSNRTQKSQWKGFPDGSLVTAYVDLSKHDSINRARKNSDYLPHINNICQYPGNLIIFCEIDMVETIWRLRMKYNYGNMTYVSVFNFTSLPLYSKINEVRRHWSEGRCPAGLNPGGKESPEFMILMWSKLYFLNEASKLNPFDSSHFAWIDIGITYVPDILINKSLAETFVSIQMIMNETPDKIRMPCICETSPNELLETSTRIEFYRSRQCKLIMGFFLLPNTLLSILTALFLEELDSCLKTGFPNTEDTVMAAVSAEHPELFDLYYGDYEDIFRSYYMCHSRVSTLFVNLRHCNAWSLYDEMLDCMDSMLESHCNDNFKLDIADLSEMYDLYQGIHDSESKNSDIYDRIGTFLPLLIGNGNEDDWKSLLGKLDLDDILTKPLLNTLSSTPIQSSNPDKSDKTILTLFYYVSESGNDSDVNTKINAIKEKTRNLLHLNQYMYIFCQKDLANFILEERTKHGYVDKTVICPLNLEDLPYHSFEPIIQKCVDNNRTSLLLLLLWSKFKFLEMTVSDNVFSSDQFVWIDFDILQINNGVHTPKTLSTAIDTLDPGHVVIPYVNNTSPKEIENRDKFYQETRQKIITSFLSVPRFLCNDLIELWTNELKINLSTGHPVPDGQILSCVKSTKPELFNCYQGNVNDIIENRFKLKTSPNLILENLRHCNALLYHRGVAEIAPQLLDGINMNEDRYSINQILQIYNEILIGCWYLEDKRHISRDAAERMKKLIPISTLPEPTKQNMKSNMGFHGITLE